MSDQLLLEEEKEFRKFYRFSSWWIDHRDLLVRIGMFVFAFFDLLLLGFAAWVFLASFVIHAPAERLAVYAMVAYGQEDLHRYTTARKATPMTFTSPLILSSGNGLYDFYAVAKNTNLDWWAEVTYRFTWSGGETNVFSAIVLPSSETPLVLLGEEISSTPKSVTMEIEKVSWKRVDRHLTLSSFDEWEKQRLRFDVTDAVFGPSDLDPKIGRVTFTIANKTAYSFYSPTFLIRLLRGTTVVGVNRVTLENLEAGEVEDVSVTWFGTLPAASTVEVIPEINPFDPDAYQALTGESSVDTRMRVFENRR